MLRLTLRTLLAYLDDTLQPAESRDIGQQIAQEPAINDLVTRIRNVMRRRRLLADSADPDHAEVDPNDVAEYLDNVLTPSRIADLEKRLLENDSDLAEVASVHQILSLVLGKPSDIPARAKERAYKLVRAKGRSHLELDPIGPTRGGNTGLIGDSGPLVGPSSTSEGAPSFSIGMGALVALLVGLLGITLSFVISGQKDRPMPPIAKGSRPDLVIPANSGGGESSPTVSSPAPLTPATSSSVPAESRPADSIIPEPTTTDTEVSPTEDGSSATPLVPAPEIPVPDAAERELTKAELPKDELDSLPGIDQDAPAKPMDDVASRPELPVTDDSVRAGMKKGESSTEETLSSNKETKETVPIIPPAAERSVPVATYVSQTGILLRQKDGVWSRLTPRSKLQSGEEIVFAEPWRAKLELPTGVIFQLVGPTQLRLNFNPAVDFSFDWSGGRILFESSSEPASIEIRVGNESGTLILDGAGKRVAGERESVASTDGKSVVWQVDLYSLAGTFEWTAEGESVSVPVGERLRIRGDDLVLPVAESAGAPKWANELADGPTEKLLGRLSDEIPLNANPVDRYRELINDNNKEIRLLAVEALASMKQVDALVEGIRHPKHEPVRRASLASLRRMIREGGEGRQSAKGALDKVYGVDGATLLQILELPRPGGSRPRELVKSLIEELDAPELALREAAISQLILLTGRDLEYSAESTSSQRKTVIGRWLKWLDSQSDEQLTQLLSSSL